MNTRDMWENQVELLTRHCQSLTREVEGLQDRVQYFEDVVLTLLVALKQAGVLVEAADGDEEWRSLTIGDMAIKLFPTVLLVVVVLGGIYGGVVTPTEAGATGALGLARCASR